MEIVRSILYTSLSGGQGKVGEETVVEFNSSAMLQTYNKAHRCGRKYLVSPLGQYLLPMSLLPAISINGIWTQFVRILVCTFRSEGPPIIFFFLFSFFSFIRSFSSFNVIATPLSRFVSRIKTFVKSRSIRESDSYVFDEEIIIYSNKLQLERTSPFLPPLSFFIEFLKQTRDRRNMRIVKSS